MFCLIIHVTLFFFKNVGFHKIMYSLKIFFSIVTQKYSFWENALQSLDPNLTYFKDYILAKYF